MNAGEEVFVFLDLDLTAVAQPREELSSQPCLRADAFGLPAVATQTIAQPKGGVAASL